MCVAGYSIVYSREIYNGPKKKFPMFLTINIPFKGIRRNQSCFIFMSCVCKLPDMQRLAVIVPCFGKLNKCS